MAPSLPKIEMIRHKKLTINYLSQSRTGKTSDFKFGSAWAKALLQPPLSMLSEVASPFVHSRATILSPSWGIGLVQTEWIRENRDIIRTFSRHTRKRLRFVKCLSCNCITHFFKSHQVSGRTVSGHLRDIWRTHESLGNRLGIAEKEGRPQLPPKGLTQAQVDEAQKKLLELGLRIQPNYHPICEPVEYQGKLVLIVWVPGGEMRPYKAPRSLAKGKAEMGYYIRLHSSTIQAKGDLEQELISLANRVPFDDRQNLQARPSELKQGLIHSFLNEVGSDLADSAYDLEIEDLGERMRIVRGPVENRSPLNVGLMFFTSDPRKWFLQTQIDVVQMPDGPGGNKQILAKQNLQ